MQLTQVGINLKSLSVLKLTCKSLGFITLFDVFLTKSVQQLLQQVTQPILSIATPASAVTAPVQDHKTDTYGIKRTQPMVLSSVQWSSTVLVRELHCKFRA